jgi:NhaA family Na+:H+ antiporter
MVGLEIKRELSVGELAQLRKALLPIMAAVGGMLVPAGIYSLFNLKGAGSSGWGVPMATDIAFAAGCIAVLRKWVPPALMVFLIALAIVDDLGAVLVIALFYTEQIAMTPLLIGSTLIVISLCMGRLGVRIAGPYVVIGMIIWLAFLESGIHATIAGVLLAFSIPVTARYRTQNFKGRMEELLSRFKQAETLWEVDRHGRPLNLQKDHMVNQRQQTLIRHMNWECHHVEAPLQRIEQTLEPFCVFLIMPLFAFANAGVHLETSHGAGQLLHPVTLGIVAGLVLGKPLGIMLASLVSVKAGWAVLPRNVNWGQLAGVGVLAGIGFTMSLFINGLAFQGLEPQAADSLIAAGKIGVFIASMLAAVIGLGLLKLSSVRKH